MSVGKRKGGRWCSVPNCKNNSNTSQDISFFSFPKDEIRAKMWTINCRRIDLLNRDALYLNKNCRICSVHFEDATFANFQRNRLKPDAIPTLFKKAKLGSLKRKPRKQRGNVSYKIDEENKIDEQIHFEENQFEQARKDGWKKLKPNAVPTLFPVSMPPKTSKRKSTNSKGAKSETETAVKNYTQDKMGFSKRVLLVNGVLPSNFECQTHLRKDVHDDCSRSCNGNDVTVKTTTEMETIGTSFKSRWRKQRTLKNGRNIKRIKMYKLEEPQHTCEENDELPHGELPEPSDELHIKEEPCDVESDDPLLPNEIVETDLPQSKLDLCEVKIDVDETIVGSYLSHPNPEQCEIHSNLGPSNSRASISLTKPVNCPTDASTLVEYIISKSEKETPQHPVDTFLAGISATLKTFPPYHLHLAKAEIFNIVQKYELETIMRNQHVTPNHNIITPNAPAASSVSAQHSTNLQCHVNIHEKTV